MPIGMDDKGLVGAFTIPVVIAGHTSDVYDIRIAPCYPEDARLFEQFGR
jgi:hypothetical protein